MFKWKLLNYLNILTLSNVPIINPPTPTTLTHHLSPPPHRQPPSMSTPETPTIWTPSTLLTPNPPIPHLALIILNQPLSLRPTIYQTLFTSTTHKIAADGGANRLHCLLTSPSPSHTSNPPLDLDLDLIIGDLDSLLPSVRSYWEAKGVQIIHDSDQYSTDFGKAFAWIQKRRKEAGGDGKGEGEDIIVLGGLGGRVDQGLSVLHHLYMYQSSPTYADGKMFLVSSEAITFLLRAGRHRIRVKEEEGGQGTMGVGLGKHIGIIPMKEASVITTRGLEWDVQEWKTEFGGLMSTSNLVREEWVEVETSRDVLFTIDLEVGGEEGGRG